MPSRNNVGGDIERSPSSSAPTLQIRDQEPTEAPAADRQVDNGDDEKIASLEETDQQQMSPTTTRTTTARSAPESSPITYRYLTFDSDLPPPATSTVAWTDDAAVAAGLPKGPDMHKYGSPLLWPQPRKYLVLFISCVATFLTAYSAGSYSPPAAAMARDLGASQLAVLSGITTFCVGFALAPMVLAPVSELYGRRPVLVTSGLLYVILQAVCSVMPNLGGMLTARLFVGIGGSTFSSVIGGVIADIWAKQDRNTPMALFSGSVLAGTGAGPLIASVMMARVGALVGETLAWKWVYWHQVIVDTVLLLGLVFCVQESRGSVLLSRKAKALNKWYEELEKAGVPGVWLDVRDDDRLDREPAAGAGTSGQDVPVPVGNETIDASAAAAADSKRQSGYYTDAPTVTAEPELSDTGKHSSANANDDAINAVRPTGDRNGTPTRLRWLVKEDEERASLAQLMRTSLTRPFYLIVAEPVVFFFSLWCAFAWAVLYLTFGSIPLAFQRRRDMDLEHAGRFFIAMVVGAIIATVVGIYQDNLLRLPQWARPAATSQATLSDQKQQQQQQDGGATAASAAAAPGANSRFWSLLRRRFPAESPESRLYFTCITATFLPAGLFLFGFTADARFHWIAPAIGIALATWGIFSVYLATFNYFADIYHVYASSALAAQSCCRNLFGGAFPLVTGVLFRNLGEERAGALLGGIAAALTVIPWCLVFWGETIRSKSRFAISLGTAA